MSKKQPRVILPKISLNSLVSMASSNNRTTDIKIEPDDSEIEMDIDMVEIGQDILHVPKRASRVARAKNKNTNGTTLLDYKQKCLQKYEAAKRELLSMLESNADAEDVDEETSEKRNGPIEHTSPPLNINNKTSDTKTDNSTLARVLNNQQSMMQMLKILSNNQKKLTQEVSSLSVKLDETYLKLLLRENSDTSGVFNNNTIKLRQLETREDLEEFESKMSDENEKRKIINQLSYLCNASTDGASCFYRLIDVLFSRQLVNECSWSGGSRGVNDKMAFKVLINTIDFIYQLVNFWDPNFTLQDTEMLLKVILRNSKKRMEAKLMRASTSRKRRKRIEIAQIDVPTDVDSEYEDNTQDKSVKNGRMPKQKDNTNVTDKTNDAVQLETRKRRRNTETDGDTDDELIKYALKLPIKIRKHINLQENENYDTDIEIETTNRTQNKQGKVTKNIKILEQIKPQLNEDSASEIEVEITKTQSKMQKKKFDVHESDDYTAQGSPKVNKNTPTIKQKVSKDSAETQRKWQNKSKQDTDNEEDYIDYEQEDTTANLDSDNSENSEDSPEHNIQRNNIINHEITEETRTTNFFGMKPIENLKEFEEFEALISDITEKQKIMNQCSLLCTPTVGKGVSFAYKLLDEMFLRKFLSKCSWCGGTYKNQGSKIPFKRFKNTVKFFFSMVKVWDSEYSMESNEIFLKCILRNAKQRAKMKGVRAHLQKQRFPWKATKQGNYYVDVDDDMLNKDDYMEQCSAKVNKNTPIIKYKVNEDSEIETVETPRKRQNKSNQETDYEEDCMDYEQEDTAANFDSDNSENSEDSPEHNIQRNNIVNHEITKEVRKTNFFGMKPIENLKEFEEFEALISDITEKHKLMNQCSLLCTPTVGKGVTFAYKLIDEMFSRKFLSKCSWSGGTRNQGRKIPFMSFKNTVQFFFLMVNFWDSEYTMESNETFLKCILKNANKRAAMKCMRAHHQKKRYSRKAPKHRNYYVGTDGDILNNIVCIGNVGMSEDAEGTIDVLETTGNICELFNNSNVSESSSNNNKSVKKNYETPNKKSVKLKLLNVKHIQSLRDLEEFETEIADTEVQQKLVEKYSVLCPKSKGNGTAFAYNLLDSMFSRDFLCNCSWLGGSKSGKTKVPIKQYQNMLKFFFRLIHHWDSNYSFDDLETFFKVVLRQSQYKPQLPSKSSINIRPDDGPVKDTTMNTKEISLFEMNPIETEEEFKNFEKLVSNPDQKMTIMNQLSVLFPISLGKGVTCAYKLMDTLFSRQFLCECTWSGGSRGDDLKICFKAYRNTISFIYQMVSFWDPSYTEDNNKEFLLVAVKHAKKRAAAKNMRISTQRRRMRKEKITDGVDPLSLTLNDESANEETAHNFLRLFKDTLQSACDDDDEV